MTVQADLQRSTLRVDLLVAIALAAFLTICWSITDWARLSRLMLPDPDDTMRLLQVRDWIAGQGINDWTQYRMAPPEGALMHWSRVNDVGIAAIILILTPLLGQHHAELVAVLLYPGTLFAISLFLSARIARRLWGAPAAPIAAIVTAIAFPGTTVFIPGRIDHHALQVVLIQLLVLLLMRPATFRIGLAIGAVTAVSLIVGLESAPQVVAIVALVFFAWVVGQAGVRQRLAGFAIALGGTTLLFLLFLRPTFWSAQYCDAFTPASATATLAGAAAFGVLALLHPRLPDWRWRAGAGVALGGVALGGSLLAFPACINGPYGAVDPFLLHWFYPHIVEANGVFAQQRLADVLAVGGVVATACAVAAWLLIRRPSLRATAAPLIAVLAVSALVMMVQIRGTYIGAPLAAPLLAGMIVGARALGRWRVHGIVAAWVASAGLMWLQLPQKLEMLVSGRKAEPISVQVACTVGETWRAVDQVPAGVVMASTNVAAYLIGATRHSTVGAGYHRNNDSNMAVYRFFLSEPARARAIGAQWGVDYVIFCPADFEEVRPERNFPGSVAAILREGQVPEWLEPIPLKDTPLRMFRVRRAARGPA